MDDYCININNKKIRLPRSGNFSARISEGILFTGIISGSITYSTETNKHNLKASEKDCKKIIDDLTQSTEWIFPAIRSIGELLSAVDREELDDSTLANTGYLISALTNLLNSTLHTIKRVEYSLEDNKEQPQ